MTARYVVGYDIGGTKLGVGLSTVEGELIGSERIPNKDTRPEDVLPEMIAVTDRLLAAAKLTRRDLDCFGISAPFPADPVNGIMTAPTNNPKWRNVPILAFLREQLAIDGCFENDANCGALAEGFFGAGRGCDDYIYLTMSTGIGGGIVANGRLVRGRCLCAGEVGHMVLVPNGRLCACGQRGCYEAYCGGRAAALALQELLKDNPDHPIVTLAGGRVEDIDMVVIEKAVRMEEPTAMAVWDDMARKNAQAFGILLNTLSPQKLILGTFAWAIGDLYLDPIRKYLPEYAWPQMLEACEIVPSELRREISAYAGAAAALNFRRERDAR